MNTIIRQLNVDERQLHILLHALTMLNYADAVVHGVRVSEAEFNHLMDAIVEEQGAAIKAREEANQTNMRRFAFESPAAEAAYVANNGHNKPKYSGPERRKDNRRH